MKISSPGRSFIENADPGDYDLPPLQERCGIWIVPLAELPQERILGLTALVEPIS
jgi:hypothetical protein